MLAQVEMQMVRFLAKISKQCGGSEGSVVAKDPSHHLYMLCGFALDQITAILAITQSCAMHSGMTHCDPLQPGLSCDPVKFRAISWAKPWPSMLGLEEDP